MYGNVPFDMQIGPQLSYPPLPTKHKSVRTLRSQYNYLAEDYYYYILLLNLFKLPSARHAMCLQTQVMVLLSMYFQPNWA